MRAGARASPGARGARGAPVRPMRRGTGTAPWDWRRRHRPRSRGPMQQPLAPRRRPGSTIGRGAVHVVWPRHPAARRGRPDGRWRRWRVAAAGLCCGRVLVSDLRAAGICVCFDTPAAAGFGGLAGEGQSTQLGDGALESGACAPPGFAPGEFAPFEWLEPRPRPTAWEAFPCLRPGTLRHLPQLWWEGAGPASGPVVKGDPDDPRTPVGWVSAFGDPEVSPGRWRWCPNGRPRQPAFVQPQRAQWAAAVGGV